MTDAEKYALALLREVRNGAAHKKYVNSPPLDRRCDLCRRIDDLLKETA